MNLFFFVVNMFPFLTSHALMLSEPLRWGLPINVSQLQHSNLISFGSVLQQNYWFSFQALFLTFNFTLRDGLIMLSLCFATNDLKHFFHFKETLFWHKLLKCSRVKKRSIIVPWSRAFGWKLIFLFPISPDSSGQRFPPRNGQSAAPAGHE